MDPSALWKGREIVMDLLCERFMPLLIEVQIPTTTGTRDRDAPGQEVRKVTRCRSPGRSSGDAHSEADGSPARRVRRFGKQSTVWRTKPRRPQYALRGVYCTRRRKLTSYGTCTRPLPPTCGRPVATHPRGEETLSGKAGTITRRRAKHGATASVSVRGRR